MLVASASNVAGGQIDRRGSQGDGQDSGGLNGQRALKVLVVDDNEDSTELLAVTLESLGHVARIAHDGPGALEAAETFPFDVALLDIGLPGMSGYELARKLRDGPRGPKAHIVALTGYGGAADRQCAEEAGFDAHMVKPIDLDGLGRMLAAIAPS